MFWTAAAGAGGTAAPARGKRGGRSAPGTDGRHASRSSALLQVAPVGAVRRQGRRLVTVERSPHAAQQAEAVAAGAERCRLVPVGRAEPGPGRRNDFIWMSGSFDQRLAR